MSPINAARKIGNAYTAAGLLVDQRIVTAVALILDETPSRAQRIDALLAHFTDLERRFAAKLIDLAEEAVGE